MLKLEYMFARLFQPNMQIFFRTDASVQIGTGHVMRCLTLADALRDAGAKCTFICRSHTGNLMDLIHQRGHTSIALATKTAPPADKQEMLHHAAWLGSDWVSDASETAQRLGPQCADWLVVDHYALDERWETALRPHCKRLMVIDDLADRAHDCDLLLDQNLGRTLEDYQPHLPHTATTLIGPRYALLRPEFSALREESLSRRNPPQLKQLLITLGGMDQDNYTEQVLNALRHCPLPSDLHITVVMGAHAPWLEKIKATALSMPRPIQVLVNVPHMARWMTVSDLCIGAGGGTAWERCSLGLPSFVIAMADNQQEGALALEKQGAARIFKNATELIELIKKLLTPNEPATLLKQLSMAAAQVTTGNGTTLVIDQMRGLHV